MRRRDWIGELRQHLYVREIAERTGISQRRLREFYTGKRELRSDMPEYEKLRNLNRQVAYEKLRRLGATPEQAKRHRRTLFDPFRKEPETEQIRFIAPRHLKEERYQLRILGLFRDRRTGKMDIAEGYSWAQSERNEEEQEGQAIRHAQNRLGSTHWEIQIILEKEWTIFKPEGNNEAEP